MNTEHQHRKKRGRPISLNSYETVGLERPQAGEDIEITVKSGIIRIAGKQLNNTKDINLLVAPTYLEDIRLNSSVPIFVNWKFHAFKNDEIIEWYERIKIVNQFYGAKSKDDQYTMLNEINSIQNTSHILVDLNKQKKLLIDCKIINFNKKYFLYDSKVCEN